MSRSSRPSRPDTLTGDLFAIPQPAPQAAGTMDYRREVSGLISQMLSDANARGMDRHEVASQASRLAGKDVTVAMLYGYTAESREEFNAPLWLSPVLEAVCESTLLTDWNASVRGGRFVVGVETLDAEIGRLSWERDNATARLRQLQGLRRRVR